MTDIKMGSTFIHHDEEWQVISIAEEHEGELTLLLASKEVFKSDRDMINEIGRQISLYEMSRSDTQGLDPEGVIAIISNVIRYGDPKGPKGD